jgi:histidine triad (HIT) family protein
MSDVCVFCEIVRGARPAHVVFEDEHSLAFLDQRPLFPGHCLLVPRKHHETLQDLPSELVGPLFLNAQLLTRAVETALQAEGVFVAINNRVSQSVPHLHIHIVPRRRKDGLKGFFWPRGKYQNEQEAVAAGDAIRAAVAELARRAPASP